MVEGLQDQLDSAGDSRLIEDPVQVVSVGIVGNIEFPCYFAVLHAIRIPKYVPVAVAGIFRGARQF